MGTGNADPRGGGEREQGFTVHLKNGARITVPANSPSIDLIIYGLEKSIRGIMNVTRLTFIDFMYYWHERLFKLAKRKPRPTTN
jgi:hypothetical protein